jgi:hypothetical protein
MRSHTAYNINYTIATIPFWVFALPVSYEFSRFERKLGVVSRDVWLKMLQIAHDLDLNKGGVYDARSGAINLWVAPDDKPVDYTWEITKGALNFPRNFLASIYGQFVDGDDNVELYLVIHNYARRDFAKYLLNHSNISYEEYKAMLELAEKGTDEEWKWATDKAKWLIDAAEKESVFKEIAYCPFCGKEFPDLQLFNDLVTHIATHVKVKAVIISAEGNLIETERGTLTPNDYIKTVKKQA